MQERKQELMETGTETGTGTEMGIEMGQKQLKDGTSLTYSCQESEIILNWHHTQYVLHSLNAY